MLQAGMPELQLDAAVLSVGVDPNSSLLHQRNAFTTSVCTISCCRLACLSCSWVLLCAGALSLVFLATLGRLTQAGP
jgi:hypothetical protein